MMQMCKIVGIVLIRNEDLYIERVIRNIVDFCDHIIVTDNCSQDQTYEIVSGLKQEYSNIELHRIEHPSQSQDVISQFAGTKTWIFAVDGDEIYDPNGLAKMRRLLHGGIFDKYWCVFGNVLNCISLNVERKVAKGYLSPPSRSMTKLYNFSIIKQWDNCPERLHCGNLIFKDGYYDGLRHALFDEMPWEKAYFRCLHTVFLNRSSRQMQGFGKMRWSPTEQQQLEKHNTNRLLFCSGAKLILQRLLGYGRKRRKYLRGKLIEMDVSTFL